MAHKIPKVMVTTADLSVSTIAGRDNGVQDFVRKYVSQMSQLLLLKINL
jgi:hypothetical protein